MAIPAPAAAMPDEEALLDALRLVADLEAGMNIVDLGLVYALESAGDVVRVEMTMTSAACPMTDMITERARNVLAAMLPEGTTVDVLLVWDPPWTPERMTSIAREHFGWRV